MRIGGGTTPGTHRFFRRADGGQTVLYYRGTADEWESNPAQGEALKLYKLTSGYRMNTSDPSLWYNFAENGRLTSIRFPNGNLLELTLDASSRIIRIDFGHETNDVDNRALEFDYTSITYGSRTRDRLWKVRHMPLNELVAEYTYNSNGLLHQVKNRFGEVVEQYDWIENYANGLNYLIGAIKARDGSGSLQTTRNYKYTWDRNLTEIADGAGTPILLNIQYGSFYDGYTFTADGAGYTYRLNHSRNFEEKQLWGPPGLVLISNQGNKGTGTRGQARMPLSTRMKYWSYTSLQHIC